METEKEKELCEESCCRRKTIYPTDAAARDSAAWVSGLPSTDHPVFFYTCEFCGHHHIGRVSQRIKPNSRGVRPDKSKRRQSRRRGR